MKRQTVEGTKGKRKNERNIPIDCHSSMEEENNRFQKCDTPFPLLNPTLDGQSRTHYSTKNRKELNQREKGGIEGGYSRRESRL